MTVPTLKLDEELSDLRSNQIAYKLTIENAGDTPIRLQAVSPHVPVGAHLLKVTDFSIAETSARKADVIFELNKLLREFLFVASTQFREMWIEKSKDAYREVFSVTGFVRFYSYLVFSKPRLQTFMKELFESFRFKITSAVDARAAYDRWLKNISDYPEIRSLFEAKLEQLEHIESKMSEIDRTGLTGIEPGATFSAKYVIRFSRGIVEPRKYQIGFNATYLDPQDGSEKSVSAAANIQISPYPLSLSIIACIAALLGLLLRISLSSVDLIPDLLKAFHSGQFAVGPILALILFNVYEYTSVGKDLKIGISWRSALLIGALCGLAQDRMLAALRALIGA